MGGRKQEENAMSRGGGGGDRWGDARRFKQLSAARKLLGPFDGYRRVHIFFAAWPNEKPRKRGSLTYRNN